MHIGTKRIFSVLMLTSLFYAVWFGKLLALPTIDVWITLVCSVVVTLPIGSSAVTQFFELKGILLYRKMPRRVLGIILFKHRPLYLSNIFPLQTTCLWSIYGFNKIKLKQKFLIRGYCNEQYKSWDLLYLFKSILKAESKHSRFLFCFCFVL